MAYGQTELTAMIQQDLEMMEGRREPVKAGFLEKMGVKKGEADSASRKPGR